MLREITAGATDESVVVRILSATTGLPMESVDYNTSGLSLWYRREGAAVTAITPAALASLTADHADGGIEHMDDGYYRIDSPDAAFAAGTTGVSFGGTVTNGTVVGCYCPIANAPGTSLVTLTCEDDDTNAVGGVLVVVKREDGSTAASGSSSDSDGTISFYLDDGDYYVHLRKEQYESTIPTVSNLTVSSTTTETFTVSYITPDTPATDAQTITGNVIQITGMAGIEGAQVTVTPEGDGQIVSSSFLSMISATTTTDSNGDFQVQVPQSAKLSVSITYSGQVVWEKIITTTTDSTKALRTYA